MGRQACKQRYSTKYIRLPDLLVEDDEEKIQRGNAKRLLKKYGFYGLRRTGKTTMLKQEMLSFSEAQLKHTVYIKARVTDTISSINKDIKKLEKAGYKYLFIDEATLMEDFIDGAALFSDVYAATGMKIVLSGDDSLSFYFAEGQELYDRTITIHTTFISYREHSRLLGITDIDDYIRCGGILSDCFSFRDDGFLLDRNPSNGRVKALR